MNPAGLNYNTLKAAQALQRLQDIESLPPPAN